MLLTNEIIARETLKRIMSVELNTNFEFGITEIELLKSDCG